MKKCCEVGDPDPPNKEVKIIRQTAYALIAAVLLVLIIMSN